MTALPVPDVLRGWVDRIDTATYRPDDAMPVHAPDPATVLLWRVTADGRGDALVMGPRTRARYPEPKDLPLCVRWRLSPGATRTLVGTSPDELLDRVVPLEELWGSAVDGPDRLTAALVARTDATQDSATLSLIRRAGAELSRPHGQVRSAARAVGVSERYLRRVFTASVGVAPKQFVRMTRLRRVLPGVRIGSFARLATEAGYYDQSHMIAQFREFMQVTPRAYAEGRVPRAGC